MLPHDSCFAHSSILKFGTLGAALQSRGSSETSFWEHYFHLNYLPPRFLIRSLKHLHSWQESDKISWPPTKLLLAEWLFKLILLWLHPQRSSLLKFPAFAYLGRLWLLFLQLGSYILAVSSMWFKLCLIKGFIKASYITLTHFLEFSYDFFFTKLIDAH